MGANFLSPLFWDSPNVVALGCCGKALLACMITGPQLSKVPGIYRAFQATFYKSMRPWSPEEVDIAFKAILVAGIAKFDEDAHVIRLPNVYKFNPPPNTNQIIGWRNAWVDIPKSPLKSEHIESLYLLAQRSDCGPKAFEFHFGAIRKAILAGGSPEPLPNGSGNPSPNGSARKPQRSRSASHKQTDHLFVPENAEGEDSDLDQDLDLDLESSFGKGSEVVGDALTNGSGSVQKEEGAYGSQGERDTTTRPRIRRVPDPAAGGDAVDPGGAAPGGKGSVPAASGSGGELQPVASDRVPNGSRRRRWNHG